MPSKSTIHTFVLPHRAVLSSLPPSPLSPYTLNPSPFYLFFSSFPFVILSSLSAFIPQSYLFIFSSFHPFISLSLTLLSLQFFSLFFISLSFYFLFFYFYYFSPLILIFSFSHLFVLSLYYLITSLSLIPSSLHPFIPLFSYPIILSPHCLTLSPHPLTL